MSRGEEPVLAADAGAVRTLTLNRPARLNAFTAASYESLARHLREADSDTGVHVVVLRGAGRAFSSGVDLGALRDAPQAGTELGTAFDGLLEALVTMRTPLLAAVQGAAVGFGATILLHCDLVLVADDVSIRFPFTSLRTSPEAGSSLLLPALTGPQRAAELLFTARPIGAAEAVEVGIALRSCPAENLLGEAAALATTVAAQPPLAVAATKGLLRQGREDALRAALARERLAARDLRNALGPMGASPSP